MNRSPISVWIIAISLFIAGFSGFLPGHGEAANLVLSRALEPAGTIVEGSLPPANEAAPAPDRFEVVFGDAAVRDRMTGLVWERSPEPGYMTWGDAVKHCDALEIANRKGWRLATFDELSSLVDASVLGSPKLPSQHPFDTGCKFGGCVQAASYWSGSQVTGNEALVWGICFCNGGTIQSGKNYDNFAWCTLDPKADQ